MGVRDSGCVGKKKYVPVKAKKWLMGVCFVSIAFTFKKKLKTNRVIKKKKKKKKELKFLKKPQFVAELIQKNKRALRKASGNLLKMRFLGGVLVMGRE
ncbi:hypothetical protein BD0097_10780 [Helicobacter pylori]